VEVQVAVAEARLLTLYKRDQNDNTTGSGSVPNATSGGAIEDSSGIYVYAVAVPTKFIPCSYDWTPPCNSEFHASNWPTLSLI
jgi:hypothetical protein